MKTKRINIKYIIATSMVVVCVFLGVFAYMPTSVFSVAAETTKIRVAFPIVEGISEIDEKGNRSGLVIDYLNEIANYTGWKYEYVDVSDPASMIEGFNEDKYDIIGGAYYMQLLEDEYNYGFPKYNIGYNKAVLLARWNDNSLINYDYSTFNGKKIGVYEKATESIEKLDLFLKFYDIDCEIITYQYTDFVNGRLYHYLDNGSIDMLLGSAAEAGKEFKAVASFNAQPMYLATNKNNTAILNRLNDALSNIYDTFPNYAEKCFQANFPNILYSNVVFTEEEQAFIDSKTVVRIATIGDMHPLFCQNEDSNHDGILSDLMALIKEKTGLCYEFIIADTYTHCYEMVNNNQADVVGIFHENTVLTEYNDFTLSQPYTTIKSIMLKNKSVTYPSENLRVGVIMGRLPPEEVDAEIVDFPTIREALISANKGEIDLVYGMTPFMEKIIQEEYLNNLVPVSMNENSTNVSFAVKKPVNALLFSLLNKSINLIMPEELEVINDRNLISIGTLNYSLIDYIYNDPVAAITIIILAFLLILTVVIIIAFYQLHTSHMKLDLAKYSAESKTKSEFLSRMSHEIRTPMNAIIGLTDLTLMSESLPEDVSEKLTKIRRSASYLLSLLNDILDISRIESGKLTVSEEPFSLGNAVEEVERMLSVDASKQNVNLTVKNTVKSDLFIGDSIRLSQVLTNLVSNAIKFTPSGGSVEMIVEEVDDKIKFSVKDTGYGISPEDRKRVFMAFEQAGSSISKSKGTGLGLPISKAIVENMGGKLEVVSTVGHGSEFYFSLPLKRAKEINQSKKEESLKGYNILLAEDNALNAEIALDILELFGATCAHVENGRLAVDEFYANHDKYDVILMDIQMPDMNGLEASEKIRSLNIPRAKTVPIIAMTANTNQSINEAKHAGISNFLSKPIDINLLYSVIVEAITKEKNENNL